MNENYRNQSIIKQGFEMKTTEEKHIKKSKRFIRFTDDDELKKKQNKFIKSACIVWLPMKNQMIQWYLFQR